MKTRHSFLLIVIAVLFAVPLAARAQETTPTLPAAPVISSPLPNQALQGVVTISGSSSVPGFASAELTFAYLDDPTGTWFLIDQVSEPVIAGPLAAWDTSTLTDGDYTLRLTVNLQDGTALTADVPGVRLRNYTPIETDPPTPAAPTETLPPGATPAPTITPLPSQTLIPPTITPLPENPAVVTSSEVTFQVVRGALITVALFAVVGLVFAIARLRR